ncbi:MAG: GNAT family N-acetyltransferase [Actinobacteria bacterium]|nr:GNAT family N-acetyltransferase [Actinomycetota bacterium]
MPELAIAVVASHRGNGIGRRLLVELIDASIACGHRAISLSVNEGNPARGLYESLGFVPIARHGLTLTMIRYADGAS